MSRDYQTTWEFHNGAPIFFFSCKKMKIWGGIIQSHHFVHSLFFVLFPKKVGVLESSRSQLLWRGTFMQHFYKTTLKDRRLTPIGDGTRSTQFWYSNNLEHLSNTKIFYRRSFLLVVVFYAPAMSSVEHSSFKYLGWHPLYPKEQKYSKKQLASYLFSIKTAFYQPQHHFPKSLIFRNISSAHIHWVAEGTWVKTSNSEDLLHRLFSAQKWGQFHFHSLLKGVFSSSMEHCIGQVSLGALFFIFGKRRREKNLLYSFFFQE